MIIKLILMSIFEETIRLHEGDLQEVTFGKISENFSNFCFSIVIKTTKRGKANIIK